MPRLLINWCSIDKESAAVAATPIFSLLGKEYGFLNPYVIAEIGVNHEGSIERAKRMIEAVAASGGHAAKFQTYKADRLAAQHTSPAYWDRTHEPTASQFELFQRWDTFDDADYLALAEHCRYCGIDFLSTPFDLEAVDLLAPLVPMFKIASADSTNIPLLRKVGKKKLPVAISAGASTLEEIGTALNELRDAGAPNITLLHCVLNYPTLPQNAELAQIEKLSECFGQKCFIGYSDHVKPDEDGSMPALEIAVLRGAIVIEKHFTDDKTAAGNDHYHAMDRQDLEHFMIRLVRMREMFGTRERDLASQSAAINNARRRIVAAREILIGDTLKEQDLVALRSNRGIEIAQWDRVIGRTASRTVAQGTPLDWADLR